MTFKARYASLGLCLLIAAISPGPAGAQEWPARTVRIEVGTAAGGTADLLARLLADKFGERFKQSFPVENRTGAGGLIAMELVRKSAPDGYTLLVTGGSQHTVLPAMMKDFPYDPVRDVTHIAYLGGPPTALVVHPNLPVNDLNEFIAYAKAHPGELSFASPGNGTHGHLTAEQFKQLAGIEMANVPYRGSNPALVDVLAGHVKVGSMTLPTVAPQISAGKLRALAVTSETRVPGFPDLPTYAEAGYPDLASLAWFGLSGPPGLPTAVVQALNEEAFRVLQRPDVRERLRPEGFLEPVRRDPKAYTDFIAAELKRWAPVVHKSGIEFKE